MTEAITCEVIVLHNGAEIDDWMIMMTGTVGDMLRKWRRQRRFSQLELASQVSVSTRHLSFVENGRAAPSRKMLLRLAEPLRMPLRERNQLLLAGGFAPLHREQEFLSREMDAARQAVDAVLAGHMPFPALAVDRVWNLISANDAVGKLLEGVSPALLVPPVNVLRITLHPDGLAPRIENLSEWRHHLLMRLNAEIESSTDGRLADLSAELAAYPFAPGRSPPRVADRVAVPLFIRDQRNDVSLSFLSTTTVFGTATDVTLSELTLECFFPANDETRRFLLEPQHASLDRR